MTPAACKPASHENEANPPTRIGEARDGRHAPARAATRDATGDTAQRTRALRAANEARVTQRAWRLHVRSDRDALRAVLLDPPAEIHHVTVLEVLGWARAAKCLRSPTMRSLNGLAVRHSVNLLVPLGEAGEHTRTWAATHGLTSVRTRG